jgi:large subunit ribosomal protein L24e
VIKERRTMRPEARSAARLAAIKESKEKRAAEQATKKADKAKGAAAASKGQTGRIRSKQGSKGAPVKVAAKSR